MFPAYKFLKNCLILDGLKHLDILNAILDVSLYNTR